MSPPKIRQKNRWPCLLCRIGVSLFSLHMVFLQMVPIFINGNHVTPPPLKNRWPCLLWLPFFIKKSQPNDNHVIPLQKQVTMLTLVTRQMVTKLYPFRPKTGDHAYFGYHTNGNHVIPPPLKIRWPCLLWLPIVIKRSKPNDNHVIPLPPKNRWQC